MGTLVKFEERLREAWKRPQEKILVDRIIGYGKIGQTWGKAWGKGKETTGKKCTSRAPLSRAKNRNWHGYDLS